MEKKELNKYTGKLSNKDSFAVKIQDEVEGDMTFTFKLKNDYYNHSYTTYHVLDPHNAEIIISNVSGNGVKSQTSIELGTYAGKYRLFLDFVIYQSNNTWNIEAVFTIAEKEN